MLCWCAILCLHPDWNGTSVKPMWQITKYRFVFAYFGRSMRYKFCMVLRTSVSVWVWVCEFECLSVWAIITWNSSSAFVWNATETSSTYEDMKCSVECTYVIASHGKHVPSLLNGENFTICEATSSRPSFSTRKLISTMEKSPSLPERGLQTQQKKKRPTSSFAMFMCQDACLSHPCSVCVCAGNFVHNLINWISNGNACQLN